MENAGQPPPYQALEARPVVVLPTPILGKDPVTLTCVNCRQTVRTVVATQNGACSYIAALVIFFLFFPCFWLPLVIDTCKDYQHICPACHAVLGTYKAI